MLRWAERRGPSTTEARFPEDAAIRFFAYHVSPFLGTPLTLNPLRRYLQTESNNE
jgi:hypothetical protein